MEKIILISIGGVLGCLARYSLTEAVHRVFHLGFPIGTLLVNVFGSFAIGILWAIFEDTLISAQWRSFLFIGFLGCLTTFSTFAIETFNLLRNGQTNMALLNILANNILAIISVIAGYLLIRIITKLI